ncbi:MAG: hypothetical protein QMD06_04565 [Candidatus Altarchaeum sp.]|nr:hypothetical protein [Candidatus Altarchaeum sp.]
MKEKKEKNCILDLDDTISDSVEHWIEYVSKKTHNSFDNLNVIKDSLSYSKYKEIKGEYRESGEKLNIKVKEGAVKLCKKLKELGYTIIILTRRPFYLHKCLFSVTKNWLYKNDIIYDALLMEDKKHLRIISEIENCRFVVDDNRYICNVIGNFGFKVFLLNNIYNQGELNNNVIRIKKLIDILKYVK